MSIETCSFEDEGQEHDGFKDLRSLKHFVAAGQLPTPRALKSEPGSCPGSWSRGSWFASKAIRLNGSERSREDNYPGPSHRTVAQSIEYLLNGLCHCQ